MLTAVSRRWWVVLLNGLVAIAFGLFAFAWPGATLLGLVTVYGIYCIVDGVTALVAATARDERGSWGQMLLVGIVSLLAGACAFLWPGLTAGVFLMVIAVWAVMRGIFEIVAAIRLRKVIEGEWMLALAGVVSIVFGLALIARPGAGAVVLVWLIAGFAIVHGLLLVTLAFKLRRFQDFAELRLAARRG